MPHGCVTEIKPASSEEVFRLLHDYNRRLELSLLLWLQQHRLSCAEEKLLVLEAMPTFTQL